MFDFEVFSVLFFIAFFAILGVIAATLVCSLLRWNKNNHSPRISIEATVTSKREQVSTHHHGGVGAGHTTHTTSYYVTFEVASSGDRMELNMDGSDYGLLCQGDRGMLTFQGTRFISFERFTPDPSANWPG